MAKPIVVTLPHQLGAQEAQRRLEAGLERLEREFASVVTSCNVNWKANHAEFAIGAMGQHVRAGMDVFDDLVRVEVQLPWILSRLQNQVAEFLERQGERALQIPAKPKADAS